MIVHIHVYQLIWCIEPFCNAINPYINTGYVYGAEKALIHVHEFNFYKKLGPRILGTSITIFSRHSVGAGTTSCTLWQSNTQSNPVVIKSSCNFFPKNVFNRT